MTHQHPLTMLIHGGWEWVYQPSGYQPVNQRPQLRTGSEEESMKTLEGSLIVSAINRGHGPFRRRSIERGNTFTCTTCGMEAGTDHNPPPNGIDIGGEMVALNCEPKRLIMHDCPNCGGHDE